MTAAVVAIPPASRQTPLAELQLRVLGAVLQLELELRDFEASGLAAEDFDPGLARKAFQISRKRAEVRQPVTVATVGSAGQRAGWFDASDVAQLDHLAASNLLRREEWLRVAEDFRDMRRAAALAGALEDQARQLRSGGVLLRHAGHRLEALAQGIYRDTAPDDDASSDVAALADGWQQAETEGRVRLLPTRIPVLDAEVGGLPPGLVVVGGRPGARKTALQDTILRAQLEADPQLHIGLFGLEDGTDHVLRRWVAEATGIPLREVGWRPRTAEERVAVDTALAHFTPLLQRLHVYRHESIRAADVVPRAMSMRLRHGVGAIWLDNLTEVELRGDAREKEYMQLAELGRSLRNFGRREGLPVCVVSHVTGEVAAGQVPRPEQLRGGQALIQRARLYLALWEKSGKLRVTVGKANELAPDGVTVELTPVAHAGLLDVTSGQRVDLAKEVREEREARQAAAARASVRAGEERRRIRDELRAKDGSVSPPKPRAPEPQHSLPGVEESAIEAEKRRAVERPSGWGMRWVDGTAKERDE